MCGIVGIFDSRGHRAIDKSLLVRMNDSMTHRGPDENDTYVEPGLGLGHRRLAIIDLSQGQQPMFNEDRSVVITYNGEIYNYRELNEELKAHGCQIRTNSDTETIIHAWEVWGEACVEHLRGMFTFAIWDQNKETLFLARDRLGIKPLYYAVLPDGTVVFGSELKSLLPYPGLERDIDPRAIEDYFAYGYIPDPKTIYRSVAKLSPGHIVTFRRNEAPGKEKPFWTFAFDDDAEISEADAQVELIDRLREAVDIRLIADVPLGAFLSGGVDSSAVVGLMADISDKPVDTCSIAFEQKDFDESNFAAMVAERYKTNHRVQTVDPKSYDLLDQLANMYDEPFADSSAIPTYRVCGLAREKVTVALSGDGGDELFAGYRRHKWHHYEEQMRRILPNGIRGPVFRCLGELYPKIDWAPKPLRAKSTLQAIGRDSVEGYFHSISILPDGLRDKLFSDTMRRELQGYQAVEVLRGHMEAAPTDDHLSRIQYADIKTYLPGDILTKVDRASMAHSLEVRVPILDHKFLEWTASLPSRVKLRSGNGKHIFKKALEPMLPNDVLYRPKMGFAVPLNYWFRGPLRQRVRDTLTGPTLAGTGYFDASFLKKLVDQHESGARDHSASIWSLVMFDSFLRQVHAA